jgi:hypothetical protein
MSRSPGRFGLAYVFSTRDMEASNNAAQGLPIGLISKSSQIGYIRRLRKETINHARNPIDIMKAEVQWIGANGKIETMNMSSLYDLRKYTDYLQQELYVYQKKTNVFKDRLESVLEVTP